MPNGIAMLENWTITSVETIENYDRNTETLISVLDEIKNFTFDNTEETSNVSGKGGRTIFRLKKNKEVKGSGASGYISGNLMSLQTGSDVKNGEISVRKHEEIKIKSGDSSVTTSETANGTAGSEIISLLVTKNGTTTSYSQATTASEDKFAYTPSSKSITLPTSITLSAGESAVIDVVYDYTANGASISNKPDSYGKTTHTFINCLGKNECDETYQIQIEVYRADWSGNFSHAMGGDGTEHPFEFASLADKCRGNNAFWNWKVFKSAGD